MKTLLFLCALALAGAVEKDQQVNLCGRELARARVLLCFGAEYLDKRSLSDTPDSSELVQKLGDWVWGGRRDALAARWGRHKRGLVDECCLKACTTDVIMMYC